MAQKLWRVVRACVELGPANPIQQIHDQGAGGNCNVVKEIIYPLGAEVNVRNVRSSMFLQNHCTCSESAMCGIRREVYCSQGWQSG